MRSSKKALVSVFCSVLVLGMFTSASAGAWTHPLPGKPNVSSGKNYPRYFYKSKMTVRAPISGKIAVHMHPGGASPVEGYGIVNKKGDKVDVWFNGSGCKGSKINTFLEQGDKVKQGYAIATVSPGKKNGKACKGSVSLSLRIK